MQRRTGGRALGAVLFTDIVGSTAIAAEMGNTRWGELVARHHRIVRREIARFGGHEVDTAGDGFFVTFERPADAIRCGVEAAAAVRELGIEIRAAVSFGELEAMGRKPGGLVVNTASRVLAVAGPGEVFVPAAVRDIVPGSGISFVEHGVHQLKGLEGEFRLFSVTDVDGHEVAPPLEAEEAAQRRREIFPAARRRGPLFAGLAAAALAVLVVGAFVVRAFLSDEPGEKQQPGSVANAVTTVDPQTGRLGSPIPVRGGLTPGRFSFIDRPLAAGEGGVWLLQPPILLHIDPVHEEVRSSSIDVGVGTSQTVTTGFDAVWELTDGTLYRVNPATDELDPFLVLPVGTFEGHTFALGDALWVGLANGTLVRLDPRTGARDQAETGVTIDRMAATRDGVWVVDLLAGGVVRIDPETLRPSGDPIEIRGSIDQIIAQGDDVWLLDRRAGFVTRINATTGSVSSPARVGNNPTEMAVGLGAVWVGDRAGSLYRVDIATLEATEFPLGAEVVAVAVENATGSLWVYLGHAAPSPPPG